MLAQIIAVTGWGEFFPWSVPALYSGMAGPQYVQMGAISYVLVILVSLAGAAGTLPGGRWQIKSTDAGRATSNAS